MHNKSPLHVYYPYKLKSLLSVFMLSLVCSVGVVFFCELNVEFECFRWDHGSVRIFLLTLTNLCTSIYSVQPIKSVKILQELAESELKAYPIKGQMNKHILTNNKITDN